jgi:hypothetical protein
MATCSIPEGPQHRRISSSISATCNHITKLRPGYSQWTSGEYITVCADRREEIAQWTATHIGAEPEASCYCVTY